MKQSICGYQGLHELQSQTTSKGHMNNRASQQASRASNWLRIMEPSTMMMPPASLCGTVRTMHSSNQSMVVTYNRRESIANDDDVTQTGYKEGRKEGRKASMGIQVNHLSTMVLIQLFDYHYLVGRKKVRKKETYHHRVMAHNLFGLDLEASSILQRCSIPIKELQC